MLTSSPFSLTCYYIVGSRTSKFAPSRDVYAMSPSSMLDVRMVAVWSTLLMGKN